ncbi:MAG TPA: cytochrome c biogenesis protein CcdA [Spirochaetia bacterium]|nr:cytochrome c biogenesis protein CcdA [Spirochaetia bacterium]HRZ65772.1 cytochrome c biogenesis protein CcdA [Spirochaetia bacterium]
MTAPALGAAFGAGLLSFLSPCVLPLIPGYLSFVSGESLAGIRSGAGRARIASRTAAFAAGFTLVFVALSLVLSGARSILGGLPAALNAAAGILVALLGLNIVFDFAKVLNLEARFHPKAGGGGHAGAFLLGLAFAAGWSPCVGPILASVLLFASGEGNALRSAALLGAYSLGLALPFLAVGLFFERLTPLMSWLKRHGSGLRIGSGLFLVALGAFMALGRLGLLSSLAARAGFALQGALGSRPGLLRLAGSALWTAAAALVASPALRGRGAAGSGAAASGPEAAPRRPPRARLLVALALALTAAGEAAGLWSTARILASWLLFQGA